MNKGGQAQKASVDWAARFMTPRVASRVMGFAADLAVVIDGQGVVEEITLGEGMEASPGFQKLVGSPWIETIAKDSQVKVDQLMREAREGHSTRARELNQKVEGLGEVPFRFSGVLLEGDRVVMLGRDQRPLASLQQRMISSQQAMDREYGRLRQADTQYRVFFHVAAEGVLVVDQTSLRVLEANPAAATLLEQPSKALQTQTLHELFDERSRSVVQSLLAAVEAGGRPADVQVCLRGQTREMTLAASLFRQSGSALVLLRFWPTSDAPVLGGARGSRILAVLDALPDGFVVCGEDHRILSANIAFCELVQQANEKQVIGQPLDRWLGRAGVDLNIMLANLREHGTVRNFATIVRGEFGSPQEALVSAVSALDGKVPCLGFTIRTVSSRAAAPSALPRSVEQLRELVGRVSLKELVRESADLIERLCIEAALDVSGNNRASAAQLLGLSRQGLYSKLRRHGLGELDPA
jgi:transcriptional regulator PpsR